MLLTGFGHVHAGRYGMVGFVAPIGTPFTGVPNREDAHHPVAPGVYVAEAGEQHQRLIVTP